LLLCAGGLATALSGAASIAAASPAPAVPAPARGSKGCLPGGNGYLRARIRGALNLDIDWHDAEIECEGGPRPDGSGLRVSFAGPRHADGRRLRLVFGVGSVHEGRTGRALPTNLTVIFEGEERVFATRGEDHCTVDELRQARLGALGGPLGLATFPRTVLQIAQLDAHRAARRYVFEVWVADTPERARQGLVFGSDLPETMGMVFPLVAPRVETMWMRNTYIELDILFIR